MFYSFHAKNSNKPSASGILDQQIVIGSTQAPCTQELRLNLGLHVEGHHSRISFHAFQPKGLKNGILMYFITPGIHGPAHQLGEATLIVVIILSTLQLKELEALTPGPNHIVQNARLLGMGARRMHFPC